MTVKKNVSFHVAKGLKSWCDFAGTIFVQCENPVIPYMLSLRGKTTSAVCVPVCVDGTRDRSHQGGVNYVRAAGIAMEPPPGTRPPPAAGTQRQVSLRDAWISDSFPVVAACFSSVGISRLSVPVDRVGVLGKSGRPRRRENVPPSVLAMSGNFFRVRWYRLPSSNLQQA